MQRVLFFFVVLSFLGTKIGFGVNGVSFPAGKLDDQVSQFSFLENKGQVFDQLGNPRTDVKYYGFSRNFSWFIRNDGVSYQIIKKSEKYQQENSYSKYHGMPGREKLYSTSPLSIHRVDFTLPGANPQASFKVGNKSSFHYNFYNTGNGLPAELVYAYSEITVENILDGISIRFYQRDGILETDYLVENQEKLSSLVWHVEGADKLSVDSEGNLEIHTPFGIITEGKPVASQGNKMLNGDWKIEGNLIYPYFEGLTASEPIIIDPPIRVWGTYYGGPADESIYALASTPNGGVVMVGGTFSSSNIATSGAHQTTLQGPYDGFLAYFSGNGSLQWATYYGGINSDVFYASIANNNYIYACGVTDSYNNIATNASSFQGAADAFVVKFNLSSGTRQWGTYLGGNYYDDAYDISLNPDNNVIVAGYTESSDFPVTSGAYQSTQGGSSDNYVTILSDADASIQHSTFLGGSGQDVIKHGLEVGNDGSVYVVFPTLSSDLPNAGSPPILNSTFNTSGFYDLYVAKLSGDLSTLDLGGYLGGDEQENYYSFVKHPSKDTFALFFETLSDQLYGQDRPAGPNGNNSNVQDLALLYFDKDFSWSKYKFQYIPRDQLNSNTNQYSQPSCVFVNDSLVLAYFATDYDLTDYNTAGLSWDAQAAPGSAPDIILGFYDPKNLSGYLRYGTHYGNINVTVSSLNIPLAVSGKNSIYLAGEVYSIGDASVITSGAYQTSVSGMTDGFLSKFEIEWVWNGNGTDTLWTFTNNWENGTAPPFTVHTNEDGNEILPDVLVKSEKLVVPTTTPWPLKLHNLKIDNSNGAKLVLRPNAGLSIEGDLTLTNNDPNGLILRSDVNNTAQILTVNTGSNFPGKIERWIEGYGTEQDKGWHFLSSPMANHPISPFDNVGGTDDFYKWSETSQMWINRTDENGNLNSSFESNFNVGLGYLIAKQNDVKLKFESSSGNLINNQSGYTLSGLTKSAGTYSGWNFIGNPYPCPVRWHDPSNGIDWSLSNIDANAQVWIGVAASYQLIYPGDHIPSACGFMVRVNNTSGGSLQIPSSARSLEQNTHWYQKSSNKIRPNQILLTAHDLEGNTWQQTVIGFNENATEGYDTQYDSYFMAGFAPQLYSMVDNEKYALNTLPQLTPDLTIPMGFRKNKSSHFTIELNYNTTPAQQVYLTDLKTHQTIELTKTSYTFEASESDMLNRFVLHFKASLGIDAKPASSPVKIVVEGQNVRLLDVHPYRLIQVYDLNGKHLMDIRNENHEDMVSLHMPFSSGVYMVRLVGDIAVLTDKIVL